MISPKIVRVKDIILDKSHPLYKNEDSIGLIYYKDLAKQTLAVTKDIKHLPTARPLYYNISQLPVKEELVYTVLGPNLDYNETKQSERYYLYPINIYQTPTSNAFPEAISTNQEYFFNQGKYFTQKEIIRRLKPYEGDITLEGRFGNSIRFGSTTDLSKVEGGNDWSQEGNVGDPITIIRNGQRNDLPFDSNNSEHITENINSDDSSIYLCSNQQINNFIPASLYDESYLEDIFKEQQKEEPIISNTPMSVNVEEDISLSNASNLPPTELQKTSELSTFNESSTAQLDTSETENQEIAEEETISLNSTYEVPDTIDMSILQERLDFEPPAAVQDNTIVSGFGGQGPNPFGGY